MSAKLVGSGILLIWAVLLGRYISHGVSVRCTALDDTVSLVEYIKRNIEAFHKPVTDILESYGWENTALSGLYGLLKNQDFRESFDGDVPDLPREATELLMKFFRELGSDYRESEVKRCDYYSAALKELALKEREKLAKNERLYKFMPPLAVISLIIVIL